MTHRSLFGRSHREKMESSFLKWCRKQFWWMIVSLFIVWYFLLYGLDWSSFHVASYGETSVFDGVHATDDFELDEGVGIKLPINRYNVTKNANSHRNASRSRDHVVKQEMANAKASNRSSDVEDGIADIYDLEKELEPLLTETERTTEEIKRCADRYIYVQKLPSPYNDDLLKECQSLNRWTNMCPYLVNSGIGPDLGNPQRVFSRGSWYVTHQFSLEVIFHNRMKQYDCLTNDSSKAAAVFVPYYAGLDVGRYLWGYYNSSMRDRGALKVTHWLRDRPEWRALGGRDHFLVAGRITWDFRRGVDEDSAWGNKFMLLPESKNMTILTIESSPWNMNDFAIPYPTNFHPSNKHEVIAWQNKMRRVRRRMLFSFAGGPRPHLDESIRSEIIDQCIASSRKCKFLECKNVDKNKCEKPPYIMKLFQNSIFCLQPPGDSFTRRSTFDSILAGCIPVFFSPGSAYVQYLWHLPRDYKTYSVLIPEDDVKNKKVSLEGILSRIPRPKVRAMRDEVIRLIPKIIYADPRTKSDKFEDAFDLSVKGVIERVKGLRRELKEGNNSSLVFDEENSWKYYTFGTVKKHEWDNFFLRTNKTRYQ